PDPTRLSISEIKKELDQRNLNYNNEENRTNLICLLKANIQQETSNMIKEIKNKYESHIVVNDKEMVDSEMVDSEMVDSEMIDSERQEDEIIQIEQEKLKDNNYFCSETVKEILKSLFHAGNEDKSERYMAKEMLQDLQQRVQTGELEADEISQLKTIENWISRYSSLYKKEAAKEAKAAVSSQKNIK
ncbi:13006_t:CDS:2, partial [Gigaspora margarita]